MNRSYWIVGLKTSIGFMALALTELVCRPLILWSRGFRPVKSNCGKVYLDREGRRNPLHFALRRAEAELHAIRDTSEITD